MYQHFENIKYLYGDDVSVQMPNDIFRKLSANIKDKRGRTNIQQTSFAYAYLVIETFLYKYAHFVDVDNNTYIQNADIKGLLGYNRTTKTIDFIIKNGGVLDKVGLTATTRDYPISFINNKDELINDIPLKEFTTIREIDDTNLNYSLIKKIVKNNNYEVKEPLFLFEYNDDNGTLYQYANTHSVTLDELLKFMSDENLNNIDFMMYCFFKAQCKGLEGDSKAIGLKVITSVLGVGKDAFYGHLDTLKRYGFIEVTHKGWVMGSKDKLEGNEYHFKGI